MAKRNGDMSRRRFLGLTAAAGAVVSTGAVWRDTSEVEITERTVMVPGLGPELDGVRVAHVSDTHLPSNRAAVEDAAAHLDRVRPEIVVITGDVVEHPSGLEPAMDLIRRIRGRLGTFAVIGNWERAAGLEPADLAPAYAAAGARLLTNECVTLSTGTGGGGRLNIIGLDDPRSGNPDPERAASGGLGGVPSLWLVHAPVIADHLAEAGPDGTPPALILAGHTHGGQIRLPPFPPPVLPKASGRFISGYYGDASGPLYVSRGIGTSGIRARVFCPAELPVITLRSA